MSKIIVAGSINMDIVAQTDRHPRPGETVVGKDLHFVPGGKGANQAVAASRLGGDVGFIGKVGEDSFGETLLSFLKGESLELRGVTASSEAPTGTALIVVDQDSENSIVVVPGCNAKLAMADLDAIPLTGAEIVVSQFEIPQPVIQELFSRAHSARALTILNPAPAASTSKNLLALTDFLVVNETELAFFARSEVIADNTRSLVAQARGIRTDDRQVVVVTLGSKGAICLLGEEVIEIPGHKVSAVDTTGAGDCFVGALAVALSEKRDVSNALRFANASAAISVQRLGASVSLPYRSEVDALLKET